MLCTAFHYIRSLLFFEIGSVVYLILKLTQSPTEASILCQLFLTEVKKKLQHFYTSSEIKSLINLVLSNL